MSANKPALPPMAAVLTVQACSVVPLQQVMGAAGLGPGPGQAAAAEGLRAHHGADHVAVDVHVADAYPFADVLRPPFDTALNAQRKAVAQAVYLLQQRFKFSG